VLGRKRSPEKETPGNSKRNVHGGDDYTSDNIYMFGREVGEYDKPNIGWMH